MYRDRARGAMDRSQSTSIRSRRRLVAASGAPRWTSEKKKSVFRTSQRYNLVRTGRRGVQGNERITDDGRLWGACQPKNLRVRADGRLGTDGGRTVCMPPHLVASKLCFRFV